MRLTPKEQNAIREAIYSQDPTAEVYLFGSRVDDSRRGGDIDLYIETGAGEQLLGLKTQMMRKIWEKLGVQRIDILLHRRGTPLSTVHKLARETGTKL